MELDRAVWEVRRYCIPRDRRTTPKGTPIEVLDLKHIEDSANHPPQGYQSPARGFLDDALGNRKHRARPALVWNNLYFGASRRNALRYVKQTFYRANSPLACSPELLDAVAEYIVLPKNLTATPRQAF